MHVFCPSQWPGMSHWKFVQDNVHVLKSMTTKRKMQCFCPSRWPGMFHRKNVQDNLHVWTSMKTKYKCRLSQWPSMFHRKHVHDNLHVWEPMETKGKCRFFVQANGPPCFTRKMFSTVCMCGNQWKPIENVRSFFVQANGPLNPPA